MKGKDGEWYEANVGGWVYVLARALAKAQREWVAWRERCERVETSQRARERKAAEDIARAGRAGSV